MSSVATHFDNIKGIKTLTIRTHITLSNELTKITLTFTHLSTLCLITGECVNRVSLLILFYIYGGSYRIAKTKQEDSYLDFSPGKLKKLSSFFSSIVNFFKVNTTQIQLIS